MGKTCCISCHCTFWTYPSNFDLIISERMMFKVPGCQDQKKSKRRSMTAPFRKVVHPGFHVRQIQKSTLLPKSKITVAGSSTCHDAYSLCRLLLVMSTRVIHHLVRRYKYLAKTGTIFAWQLSDHHILFLKIAWRFNSSFSHARSKFFRWHFHIYKSCRRTKQTQNQFS